MKIYSVTEVLGKYFDWNSIPADVLAAACERGSAVHLACGSLTQLGYAMELPAEWRGYVESFKNWYQQNVSPVGVILAEKRFTDEALGLTGRPDFVFKLNTDETVLVDIKTPLAESPTWKCQLAAYRHLVTKIGGIEIDDMLSLRLKPDGGPARGIRYGNDYHNYFNVFLSALNAHRGILG